MPSNHAFKKRIEGVRMTSELRVLLEQCQNDAVVSISKSRLGGTTQDDSDEASSSSSAASRGMTPLSPETARSLLQEANTDAPTLSLSVVRAMYSCSVLRSDDSSCRALEEALFSNALVFSTPPPPPSKETDEQRRFRKRMDRLKLKAEETRYKKLTHNLDTAPADDVTTKSMTYAASVGLNMIVAPISFGVFMYFFAGPLFSWILPQSRQELRPHETDVRRVIAGVVSGVIMLFIEMILFVIRTHEFEASMRKKSRQKKGVSPFGYSHPTRIRPSSTNSQTDTRAVGSSSTSAANEGLKS